MNLLEFFVLQHIQTTALRAELTRGANTSGAKEARVELNLIPRLIENQSDGSLPGYQVSARLVCEGGQNDEDGPAFKAEVGLEVVYQQFDGEPIDVSEFTRHHAALARQIYPLMQQDLRGLLMRLGLHGIALPFDIRPRTSGAPSDEVEISSAVH